jgi:hypothetical protein
VEFAIYGIVISLHLKTLPFKDRAYILSWGSIGVQTMMLLFDWKVALFSEVLELWLQSSAAAIQFCDTTVALGAASLVKTCPFLISYWRLDLLCLTLVNML